MDSDGNILVTDCLNHRVHKFSAGDLQFLATVGTRGSSQINNKLHVVDGHID